MGAHPNGVRLSDAIEEALAAAKALGAAPATLRTRRVALDRLLLSSGNILVKNITSQHVEIMYAQMAADGLRASTVNLYRSHLKLFFKWCQARRYTASMVSPMDVTRPLQEVPREWLRVPASKFPHLLDCAPHPRDRMIVALGLYLFLRQSEIKNLRVQDVNLEDGFLSVIMYKTKQRDEMPISEELDEEFRRWLHAYSRVVETNVQGDWYLFPARTRPQFTGSGKGSLVRVDAPESLRPLVPLKRLESIAKGTLERAGYQLRDDEGVSNAEGMHTLRRSGARAYYDQLVEGGYDGAIRQVQSMLHHSSSAMTERYLGITLDRKKRDEAIRGKKMFVRSDSSNLVHLQDRRVN